MFDKATQPLVEIYDGITNEYLGRSLFRMTPEAENAILSYARNEKGPDRVVLQDVNFYPVSASYVLPSPYKKYSRRGIFKVMLRDKYSLLWTPVEIYAKFNIMGRAQPEKDKYYFPSLEYSDIVIQGMKVMPNQVSELSK